MFDPTKARYVEDRYHPPDKDGPFKARQLRQLIEAIPDKESITSYADVGCGDGSTLTCIRKELCEAGFPIRRVAGYDISPFPDGLEQAHPEIEFIHGDFFESGEDFDLITLNDVIEHVGAPQDFLSRIGMRARYVALHIPLDDRLIVLLTNQYNYRLQDVGHLSFWNPSSAINLLTSAGFLPLHCRVTPGFLAPSSRERVLQWLALPVRALGWLISPGLTAITVGGVSLAVLCRTQLYVRRVDQGEAANRCRDPAG